MALCIPAASYLFLPVFHDLQIVSVNQVAHAEVIIQLLKLFFDIFSYFFQYLEQRFHGVIRRFASLLFFVKMVTNIFDPTTNYLFNSLFILKSSSFYPWSSMALH